MDFITRLYTYSEAGAPDKAPPKAGRLDLIEFRLLRPTEHR